MTPNRRPPPNRRLTFTDDEMDRIRVACQALGTSYAEFIRFATMAAVDEVEGIGRLLDRVGGPSESQVAWVLGGRVTSR